MSESAKKNDTRAEDLEEARALLAKHILAGLREPAPKASFLSVAHRFLVEEAERLARLKTYDFGAVSADLPFPVEEDTASSSTGSDSAAARPVDPGMAAVLASLPFKTDEDDS